MGRISYYKGPISNLSPHGEPVDLQWLREATRAGINAEYQEKIARLREMYAEGDEDGSKKLKNTLDYITTCGVFTRRNIRGLVEHSGYITLDFDKIREKGQSPEEVKEEASRHPAVAMAFTSPGGDGVKVVVVLKDRPKTNKENHQAYNAACEALGLAVPADQAPKAVSAACFLSFDPDCYYAAPETVGPFDWRAYADSHAKKSGRKKGKRAGSQSAGTAGKGDGIPPTPAEWRERWPHLYEAGTQLEGPCPACGGTKRFHVNLEAPHLWSCRECPDDDRMAPLYAAFPERSPILGGDPGGSTNRPWWVEGEFLNPWSCTNDADCARGVRQNAADFLVVETDQPAEEAPDPKVSAWLLVDNRHGIWVNNLGRVHHRLADTAIEWAAAAIRGGRRDAKTIAGWARGMAGPDARRKAAGCIGRVVEGWRQAQVVPPALKTCQAAQLDANWRFMGVKNGVLALSTGQLLSREEARGKFVTRVSPVTYDPAAKHPAVDRLTEHLEPGLAEFLWRRLGRGLWGWPEKSLLLLIGPPDSGKTTLFIAIRAALGPEHTGALSEDAMQSRSKGWKHGPTPEREVLVKKRFALGVESEGWRPDPAKIKAFAGGGDAIDYQPKFQREQTSTVRATIAIAANKMPFLGLHDAAIRDRCLIIPYTCPPVLDSAVKDAFAEEGDPDSPAARAMLACLVRYAVDNPPGTEIKLPEAVVEAVREAQLAELGPFGRWLLSNVEEDLSQNVTIRQIWDAWARQAGGNFNDNNDEIMMIIMEIGGFLREEVSEYVQQLYGMPPAKTVRPKGGGTPGKGWRGLRLRG